MVIEVVELTAMLKKIAGIVELTGLPDDDGPGADEQDLLDVGALRHGFRVVRQSSSRGTFSPMVRKGGGEPRATGIRVSRPGSVVSFNLCCKLLQSVARRSPGIRQACQNDLFSGWDISGHFGTPPTGSPEDTFL